MQSFAPAAYSWTRTTQALSAPLPAPNQAVLADLELAFGAFTFLYGTLDSIRKVLSHRRDLRQIGLEANGGVLSTRLGMCAAPEHGGRPPTVFGAHARARPRDRAVHRALFLSGAPGL